MAKRAALMYLITGACCVVNAQAQTYPAKPFRIICPAAPGGISDILSRIAAQRLGAHYGRHKGAGVTTINSASPHYRNASKVIDAFDRGVPIRSNHGFYLAIPTEKA